ncbi:MarR family winged helix-turn-helix transcriptional regulator [Microbacterium enclense]|uniref:MarR family winged helix-turn-helix transcriptional regulator n=1 Tax=Microbacterium enclense TaxID=993073 RepID=UPI003D73D025
MNTSTPLDPRSLAHRLTTVGHALHHRLFAQLRDSDLHPKTVLVLRAIDGRIDAPWIAERLARGGKRVTALAERGWIERTDDGWALTAEGREILDRVDADRSALLADVPAEELESLVAALDAVSAALGIDASDATPFGRGFGPGRGVGPFGPGRGFGAGFGPGFGPGRGFGPGFGPGARGSARGEHGAEEHGGDDHGHGRDPRHGEHAHHGRHAHHGYGRDDRRSAQRAYERGFDAGFSRGREASASGDSTASE